MFARALAAPIFAALIFATGAASAQTYPDRPVTMIVAFPPGGADDATARMIQDPFQKALGQPVVIENIGGAGGMIAAAKAARAEPDGYTILLHQDALAAGMTLYPHAYIRRGEGFCPDRPRQYHHEYACGPSDAAREQLQGAVDLAERTGTPRQDRTSGRRLVRSFGGSAHLS